jgi:hypothetical protein
MPQRPVLAGAAGIMAVLRRDDLARTGARARGSGSSPAHPPSPCAPRSPGHDVADSPASEKSGPPAPSRSPRPPSAPSRAGSRALRTRAAAREPATASRSARSDLEGGPRSGLDLFDPATPDQVLSTSDAQGGFRLPLEHKGLLAARASGWDAPCPRTSSPGSTTRRRSSWRPRPISAPACATPPRGRSRGRAWSSAATRAPSHACRCRCASSPRSSRASSPTRAGTPSSATCRAGRA